MNKKMKEILLQIENKTALAKGYMTDGEGKDVEKAAAVIKEIEALEAEYEAEKKLFELEKKEHIPSVTQIESKEKTKGGTVENDTIKAFANAARNGFKVASMSEGVNADGGYTVPEDVSTKIYELKEAGYSLRNLITVEKVSTVSGARTFKSRKTHKGFTEIGEGGKIGKIDKPSFERIDYKITKKAGYLPVTNELLSDSDENIYNTITKWFADESNATDNKYILAAIATLDAVAFAGLDDIKKAFNVTLGSAFKNTSKLVTNDDGLQYLDTLKDNEGRPILARSAIDPMAMVITAGATTIPLEVVPNNELATKENKIPMIAGDLKEGIVEFDREQLSIKQSDTAVIGDFNAYEEDLVIFRGIERNDIKVRDKKAIVNGYITVPSGNA